MSLFEMIPDRPLIMPTGAHTACGDAHKKFGLREKTCDYCGKTYYTRMGEVEYIRRKSKKELHFCS